MHAASHVMRASILQGLLQAMAPRHSGRSLVFQVNTGPLVGSHDVLGPLCFRHCFCVVHAGKEAAAARRVAARFATWLAKYVSKQRPPRRDADDVLTRLNTVRGLSRTMATGMHGSLWTHPVAIPCSSGPVWQWTRR